MLFKKNDKIGTYVVVFPHKQGSYAETYRVKDANGKTHFLKLINYSKLHHQQIDDNGQITEVEIAKQLNHHNLCQYVDSGNMMIGGHQYAWLVTEFVSGETLSERIIRDSNLSVYEIKTIVKAVLFALSYLHSQQVPIIHNEVTIQNILLNLAGDLKDLSLIDFGHARYLGQAISKPNLDELNPFYLAPERFSGVYSVQTDLYSVGVMMYHLLYGRLPWFIDISKKDNQDVIFTKDTHYTNYLTTREGKHLPVEHCIIDSEGHALYGKVADYEKDAKKVFNKTTFGSRELAKYISRSDYEEVEFCGLVSNICVLSNIIMTQTFNEKVEIFVDLKATKGLSDEVDSTFKTYLQNITVNIKE